MKIKSFSDADDNAQVDLTPLIDVVFILLIFFILSASFVQDKLIPVDRPSAQSSEQSVGKTLQVTLDKQGQLWFKNDTVSIKQLAELARIKSLEETNITAILNADEAVSAGKLVQVIDALRLAGVEHVAVATQD